MGQEVLLLRAEMSWAGTHRVFVQGTPTCEHDLKSLFMTDRAQNQNALRVPSQSKWWIIFPCQAQPDNKNTLSFAAAAQHARKKKRAIKCAPKANASCIIAKVDWRGLFALGFLGLQHCDPHGFLFCARMGFFFFRTSSLPKKKSPMRFTVLQTKKSKRKQPTSVNPKKVRRKLCLTKNLPQRHILKRPK